MPRFEQNKFLVTNGPPEKKRQVLPKLRACDWEEHKETILHLAISEKRTCPEIERALKKRNFIARSAQIGHKLKEWGACLSKANRQYIRATRHERGSKKTAFRMKKGSEMIRNEVIDSSLERNRERDLESVDLYESPDVVAYTPSESGDSSTNSPAQTACLWSPSTIAPPSHSIDKSSNVEIQPSGPPHPPLGGSAAIDGNRSSAGVASLMVASTYDASPAKSSDAFAGAPPSAYAGTEHGSNDIDLTETDIPPQNLSRRHRRRSNALESIGCHRLMRPGEGRSKTADGLTAQAPGTRECIPELSVEEPVALTSSTDPTLRYGNNGLLQGPGGDVLGQYFRTGDFPFNLSEFSLEFPSIGGITGEGLDITSAFSRLYSLSNMLQQSIEFPSQEPQSLLTHLDHGNVLQFLTAIAYLISNNMLPDDHIKEFLQWAADHKQHSTLKKFLSTKLTTTTEAFGAKVFTIAVNLADMETVSALLSAGVIPLRVLRDNQGAVLKLAAERGSMQVLQHILETGIDVNAPDRHRGKTALQAAAERGHVEIIQLLLEAGANINAPGGSPDGKPALHAAAEQGLVEIIQLLLEAGANINVGARWGDDKTAIEAAARRGHVDAIEVLLEAGANASAALRAAASQCNADIIRGLLEAGADVADPEIGSSALRKAIVANVSTEGVRILLQAGADPNPPYHHSHWSYDETTLELAIEKDNIVVIRMVLEALGNANGDSLAHFDSPRALKAAVRNGNVEVVRTLLAGGAIVDQRDPYQYRHWHDDFYLETELQIAVALGNIEIIQLLLEAGADVNAPCKSSTALQEALEGGNIKIVRLLLDAGADVNAPTNHPDSTTALHIAILHNNIPFIRLLLDAGADIDSRSFEIAAKRKADEAFQLILLKASPDFCTGIDRQLFENAFLAAVRLGNIDAIRTLLKAGADVNARPGYKPVIINSDGDCIFMPRGGALEVAASRGNLGVIQILLEAGANVNDSGPWRYGKAALGAAVQKGKATAIRALLAAGANANARASYKDRWCDVRGSDTALQFASWKGNIEIIQILLDAGADVNASPCRNWGRTALQAAAAGGYFEAVHILLDAGADLNAPPAQFRGLTALQGAAIAGHIGIAEMLIRAGADVNAPAARISGRTALEGAAEHGRLHMVHLLLRANHHDNGSRSLKEYTRAARFAETEGHIPIAKLLKDLATALNSLPKQAEVGESL